jgi:hypothetical protein
MANRVVLGIETDDPGNYQSRMNNREKKLIEAVREDTNLEDTFDSPLVISATNLNAGQDPDQLLLTTTLAAGDEFAFSTRKGSYHAHVQSVNGTVVNTFPRNVATGMELQVTDGAVNGVLGWEVVPGAIHNNSYLSVTIGSFEAGTDKDYYIECKVTATDISDVNEFAVGFRNDGAFAADMDDYTDLASLRIDASGDVQISTILNNAATSDTDTTVNAADATQIILRVEVQQNGICRFIVDGTQSTVATFTFDDADDIVPFMYLISDTDDPEVIVNSLEVGYM